MKSHGLLPGYMLVELGCVACEFFTERYARSLSRRARRGGGVLSIVRSAQTSHWTRSVECRPKRSLLLKGDYFVDTQVQCVSHRLHAVDGHASVACGFIALNLLLRESHSVGQRFLREVANNPRLN